MTLNNKNSFKNKSLVSILDLSKQAILEIIQISQQFKQNPPNKYLFQDLLVGSCFFEPSTRTRLSFESAIKKLAGATIGFSAEDSTSVQKGENLYDSIKVIEKYVDLIILRHSKEGAARLASSISEKPIINAGDGAHEHPTQSLLDLFTIYETQGKIENLNIAVVGDLKNARSAHSLIQALGLLGVNIYFFAIEGLELPNSYENSQFLDKKKLFFYKFKDLTKQIKNLDIVYVTRLQKERFDDVFEYQRLVFDYKIDLTMLKDAKTNLKLLHPLPRLNELDYPIDQSPYAYYFQQAGNGIYVRQALIALIMGKI